MDWTDSTRIDRLEFQMVNPHDRSIIGNLDGVVLDGSSITYAYYTDTRVSGTLKLQDSNYLDNAMVRVIHHVDASGYAANLGTFFVTGENMAYEHGCWSGSLDLHSALYIVTDDVPKWAFTCAKGTGVYSVLATMLDDWTVVPYRIFPDVPNTTYSDTLVYDYGTGMSDILFDVCDKCGARVDVDGDGTIVFDRLVSNSSKTPVMEIDCAAVDSIVSGGISVSSDRFSTVNAATVYRYDSSSGKFVSGWAELPDSSPASYAQRGRRVVKVCSDSDLDFANWDAAYEKALAHLDDDDAESREYLFQAFYLPYNTGTALTLRFDGNPRKCMIKTKDVSLGAGMPTKYTMKAV